MESVLIHCLLLLLCAQFAEQVHPFPNGCRDEQLRVLLQESGEKGAYSRKQQSPIGLKVTAVNGAPVTSARDPASDPDFAYTCGDILNSKCALV